MSDFPYAADSGYSDPDTLGAIPPVVAATYCAQCGRSMTKSAHSTCDEALRSTPPTYCTTCRRELDVTRDGRGWTATCKKHGESNGTLAA